MKTEQQNVSEEDLVAVTERNTRAKTSSNGGEPIPVDLIVEICSRLPAKSISRCRCVSKLWDSSLCLPYFTELFLTRSLAHPKLLFARRKDKHVFFFSSSQPQNLDDNNSSLLAASYRMKIPYYHSHLSECSSVGGLMFIRDERVSEGKKRKVSVICNPSTGQSVTLPKLKTRKSIGLRSYFGYEPIEKLYKVLSMTWKNNYGMKRSDSEEHQVLTFGHRHGQGLSVAYPILFTMIVTMSAKFRFVENTDPLSMSLDYYCTSLINCNGKLGLLRSDIRCTSISLRVLEDAEKQEWSEHVYLLPASLKNIVGGAFPVIRVVGVTRTNEIVFSISYRSKPFYIFYYNTERNVVRRVEIQGLVGFEGYTYLDPAENVNVKLLEGLSS